jgi:hypothetical protein
VPYSVASLNENTARYGSEASSKRASEQDDEGREEEREGKTNNNKRGQQFSMYDCYASVDL